MRNLLVFLIFISLTNLSVAQSDPAEKFIGTWFLQKFEAQTESGDWISFEQMGPNPFGILMYDNVGNMAVQIARQDRSIPDPDNVIADIVNGYAAYVGAYEINRDGGTVTHHRSAHINPDLDDLSVVRYFQFDGKFLILTLAPDRKLRLTWKRQN